LVIFGVAQPLAEPRPIHLCVTAKSAEIVSRIVQ